MVEEEEIVCFRCGRGKDTVKLIDAIYGREIEKICEECAATEDIPLIRKPTSDQLKESERPYSVRQRLNRMTGADSVKKGSTFSLSSPSKDINLDNLRKPKDYQAILNRRFESIKKRNQPLNLIDNYNWHILMARRNRKMSRKQVADVIGESENTLRIIEDGFLPDDASRVINKLEQYFGMNLRVGAKASGGIPAPKPAVVLKFDPSTAKNITIDDLRRMKQAREQAETEGKEVVVDMTQEQVQETVRESKMKKVGSFFKNLFKSEKAEEVQEKTDNSLIPVIEDIDFETGRPTNSKV